jgi:hypothetical protein
MRIRTLTTAVLLAIGFAVAAPTVNADVVVGTKHHYVYFGDHQIYFAPDTKTYYWMSDGRWTSGVELPPEQRAYVTTGGVEIDLDTERPYERHEWVIQHYRDKHHEHDKD